VKEPCEGRGESSAGERGAKRTWGRAGASARAQAGRSVVAGAPGVFPAHLPAAAPWRPGATLASDLIPGTGEARPLLPWLGRPPHELRPPPPGTLS